MRKVYLQSDIPSYLDATAIALLQEARSAFNRFELLETSILQHGSNLILFPWVGAKSQLALTLALRATGLKVWMNDFALECPDTELEELRAALSMIANNPAPDPIALAAGGDLELDKFDHFLSDDMKSRNFARAMLDTTPIPQICENLFEKLHEA